MTMLADAIIAKSSDNFIDKNNNFHGGECIHNHSNKSRDTDKIC